METLVKEYEKALTRAYNAKQLVVERVEFRGFPVGPSYDAPFIGECPGGLVAVWQNNEIPVREIIKLMNTKGYIEPGDF